MLCSDSIHSRLKLYEQYPDINMSMIERLYGHEIERHNRDIWVLKSMYPKMITTSQVRFLCNVKLRSGTRTQYVEN